MSNPMDRTKFLKALFVPSDELRDLRSTIRSLPDIEHLIGNAVQFRVVLDTNAVLKDLIWLSKHRKKQGARTSLLEVIASETVKAYAPTKLLEEVEEHLPRRAREESVALEVIQREWEMYKQKLEVYDPAPYYAEKLSREVDPNDINFVALAEEIKADAIVSEDGHINRMGGHPTTLDFIISVRDYSRASAIELSIKFRGVMFGVISIGILTELIKVLITLIGRIPTWLKIVLILLALGVILHPKSREKIMSYLTKSTSGIKEVMPGILEAFRQIVVFTEQQNAEANKCLEEASAKIERTRSK